MKQAIKKYGKENFKQEVISVFPDAESAYAMESELVDDTLINDPRCYNIYLGGGNPPTGAGKKNNFYGKKHSEETIKKISLSRKGKLTGKDHPSYKNTKLYHRMTELVELYKSGMSLMDISNIHNINITTLWNHLRTDKECKILMEQNNSKIKNSKITVEDSIEMKKLYMEGISYREIGRRFGITHHTAIKHINKEN